MEGCGFISGCLNRENFPNYKINDIKYSYECRKNYNYR